MKLDGMTDHLASACRFCGRGARRGRPGVTGPIGPICADCVQAGLRLLRDGTNQLSKGGTVLIPLYTVTASVCEYCGRRERRTFLGRRRTLARMSCEELGAVICLDCLDQAGDLINQAVRS